MSIHIFISSSWRPVVSSSRQLIRKLNTSPTFPTVPTCPSPTCQCAATPVMPKSFEIDYKRPLNGTMAPYAEQILICTGKSDWVSRIEEENEGDNLAADLKELLGRGGIYSDPYHNVSLINSSFPPSIPKRAEVQTTSAYLFPSFKYVPFLPRVSFDSVQALVKGYILPRELNPAHDALSPIHKDRLRRGEEYQSLLFGVQDVDEITVLICGHGGRDVRCGIYGPLLQAEFEKMLPKSGIEISEGPVPIAEDDIDLEVERETSRTARVGLISHIGGHKFAGNAIIYIPPKAKSADGQPHSLAGCGIWYGRVEPKHVEGIVNETVLGGKVIADLFRGGIRKNGEIMRL